MTTRWLLVAALTLLLSGLAGAQAEDTSGPASETKLQPSDGAANDLFGIAVSVSGNTALAGTYDGDTMRLYVNGRLAQELSGVPFDASSRMTAGATTFFNGNQIFYTGLTDEIRIWDVARTGKEIRSTIHTELQGDESGLVGYWKIDEGAGQEVADSTGAGVTGLLGETDAAESKDPLWVESQALRVPQLSVTGSCPGTTTLSVSNANSNAQLILLKGTAQAGALILPAGPCAGSEIRLENPSLLTAVIADENGDFSVDREVPGGACGLFLQVFDVMNCAVSNVVQILTGPGEPERSP